jgi:hypothetical protein
MAMNALQDVRRFRRYSQAITAKTRSHISNTNKTRTSSQHNKIQRRINRAAATYRAALSAIKKLDPEENFGTWKTDLCELRKEDIRGPAREGTETSESHHVPSWIWQTSFQASASANDKDFYTALQVEWCKAQERAARYEDTGGKGWCPDPVHHKYIAWKWTKDLANTHPEYSKDIQNFPSQFN